jgi:hypothetical protein
MPYTVVSYTTGSTTLPFTLLDGRYDISTSGASPTPSTPLAGGGEYDEYGADRAPRQAQVVKIEEVYQSTAGNTAIKAWKAVHRTKGKLYRRDDNTGTIQWTMARLSAIPITRTADNAVEQGIALQFYLYNSLWSGSHHGGLTLLWDGGTTWDSGHVWSETVGDIFPLTSSASTVVALVNDGNETVNAGIFTIVAGDAAITSVHIVCVALGVDFTWTGTVAALSLLVIDTGAQRITNGGIGAYGGFSRGVNHTLDQPISMPVPPGSTNYTVSIIGGGSVVTSYMRSDYSDGWN